MSTNIHAAALASQWFGTDFNPSQAGFAQELAAASGAGAQQACQALAARNGVNVEIGGIVV